MQTNMSQSEEAWIYPHYFPVLHGEQQNLMDTGGLFLESDSDGWFWH